MSVAVKTFRFVSAFFFSPEVIICFPVTGRSPASRADRPHPSFFGVLQ